MFTLPLLTDTVRQLTCGSSKLKDRPLQPFCENTHNDFIRLLQFTQKVARGKIRAGIYFFLLHCMKVKHNLPDFFFFKVYEHLIASGVASA